MPVMFISLDPVKLEAFATTLRTWAQDAEDERSAVSRVNDHEDDPVDVAPDVGVSSTLAGAIDRLETVADDLDTRREEAVAMNSNGVTVTSTDGTVSYYLPEDVADTAANVTTYNSAAWAQAQGDAVTMGEVIEGDKAGDGRSYDEVIRDVKANQDNPMYALAFTEAMGVAAMLDAPLTLQADTNYALDQQPEEVGQLTTLFGTILASASATYTATPRGPMVSVPGSATFNLAGATTQAVTEVGHEGRATVLDHMMALPGTVYGTDYLVDLACALEQVDSWPDMPAGVTWHGNWGNDDYGDHFLPGGTTDPLAAVLHGMGNNPEAALRYLAPGEESLPPGHGAAASLSDLYVPALFGADERKALLAARDWDSTSLAGLSAAFAAVSSLRSPAPGQDTDDRASWATANGISLLAGESRDGQLTQTVKQHVGVMLGNCGAEITGLASNAAVVPTGQEPYRTAPITSGGGDQAQLTKDLSQLLYDVVDDPVAASTIAEGTTLYTGARADAAVLAAPDASEEEKLGSIKKVYEDQGQVLSLLTALAQDHAEGEAASFGTLAGAGAAAASVISLYPGAALPAGVIGGTLSLADVMAPEPSAPTAMSADSLEAAAFASASRHGLVEELPTTQTSWYNPSTGEWTVDPDSMPEFNAWVMATSVLYPGGHGLLEDVGHNKAESWFESGTDKNSRNASGFKLRGGVK